MLNGKMFSKTLLNAEMYVWQISQIKDLLLIEEIHIAMLIFLKVNYLTNFQENES